MRSLLKKVGAVLLSVMLIAGIVMNVKVNSVMAGTTVLTSPLISITGFQIKTNGLATQGICFRTVCKAPDKGSVMTVNGKQYTVKEIGTVYTKDSNTSGSNANNAYNASYTLLNPVPYPQEALKKGYDFKYVGEKSEGARVLTFGYIATDNGVTGYNEGYTSYARTMTNMDAYLRNSLFVRAFVEAADEEGNNVLIYSDEVQALSVAQIAHQVYVQGKAPDKEGHEYIYDKILHKLPTYNPFYMDETVEYGWGGGIATP